MLIYGLKIIYSTSSSNNNNVMEEDDCCGGGVALVENQQQQFNHSHQRQTASNKLVRLLLCLPALRQTDQLIRQYWTRVHRDNQQQQQLVTNAHQNTTSGFASGLSATSDRSLSAGGTSVVRMNKLFVEMLEACLR